MTTTATVQTNRTHCNRATNRLRTKPVVLSSSHAKASELTKTHESQNHPRRTGSATKSE